MVSMLPDMMAVAVGMALGVQAARRAALRAQLLRRRRDLGRRLARGDEPRRAATACPSIFVLEHNGYAYSTPSARQFAVDPLERAAAYGIAGVAVDGNDVEAVFEATRQARERALAGGGPTLIAAQHDADARPRRARRRLATSRRELERWAARDPLERQRARLRELGVDVEAIERAVRDEVDRPRREALAMAPPDPASALDGVFCEGEPVPLGRGEAPWSGFAVA